MRVKASRSKTDRRVLMALVLAVAAVGAYAEEPSLGESVALTPGTLVPKVEVLGDPSQQYALYLPESYDPARPWPTLFVLDPRGRAVRAAKLFEAAAERHGIIVLSSYQSRSDTLASITVDAFRAMLGDAEKRFALDARRIYLAGFSGTARLAWYLGFQMGDATAGVIGCGGGLPPGFTLPEEVSFPFYGAAGTIDFNYREQHALDAMLAERGATHHLHIFDGYHDWPPAPITEGALDWLALDAMKRGLAPRDDAFVASFWQARKKAAEDASDPLRAVRRYRQLVRDFEGLRPPAEIEAAGAVLAALDRASETKAARKKDRKLAGRESSYRGRLESWLASIESTEEPPPTRQKSLFGLQVDRLHKDAAKTGDPLTAASAHRRLESAYVQASFYLPQRFEEAGDLDRAAAVLDVATGIRPNRPRAFWRLAEIYAKDGRTKRAFEALRGAIALGRVDWQRLRTDPAWEGLRADPAWAGLFPDGS